MEVVIVQNCIEREGLVFIKKDAKVGVGVEGGGITSTNTTCLAEAEGRERSTLEKRSVQSN